MMSHTVKSNRTPFITALVAGFLICLSGPTAAGQLQLEMTRSLRHGLWGSDFDPAGHRLAFNDDIALFRFELTSENPTVYTLFADRLVRGERVPMYKVEDLQYDERSGTITKTGPRMLPDAPAYSFVLDRRPALDTLEVTFFSSDGSVSRYVQFRRVDATLVPPTPDPAAYPSFWSLENGNTVESDSDESPIGTWIGDSMCVDNPSGCKDETFVYSIEAVPDNPRVLMLFADRLMEGKRIAMYKQELSESETSTLGTDETTRPTAGRFWEYHVVATGEIFNTDSKYQIVLLAPKRSKMHATVWSTPDDILGRSIELKRVNPNSLAPAPAAAEYR